MFPASILNTITSVLQSFPEINQDAKKQVIKLVGSQLHKLDLVTREEFEVQCKTLEKTRQIVTELEQRVQELEQAISPAPAAGMAADTTPDKDFS